jgi:hypothetical protein
LLREWRLRDLRETAVERLSDPIVAAGFDSERERREQSQAIDVGFDVLQTLGLTLEEGVDVTASLLY